MMAQVRALEIRSLRGRLGLSQELFSRVLDVSARSVERWEAKEATRVDAETSRRLAVTQEILALAGEVYGEGVGTFMATPRRSLAMRTPREAMVRGDLEEVRQVLVNALDGHWV
jgi:transcriptional regulator with XRE-family HTH domain